MSVLVWNDGDFNMAGLVGFLDLPEKVMPGSDQPVKMTFAEAVAVFRELGAIDEPHDKATHGFMGTFDGATFTLYDYNDDATFHIGGHAEGWGRKPVDVEKLKAHLTWLLVHW